MKKTILFLSVLALCVAGLAFAEKIPEQLRNESREYPAAIEKSVQSLNRKKLLDDAYFVKSLKTELKNKKHSEEEKVYYFYLMLRQIRWGFAGALWMRPNGHYAEEFFFQSRTYAAYRTELQKLKLDSAPFYQLCHDNAETKPLLASHALLLATMLEKDDGKAFEALTGIMDTQLIQAEDVAYPLRPMLIHNLCYGFAMIEHEDKLPALATMMDAAVLEEEKEDIVIAGAMSRHELSVEWVFQQLIAVKDSADDLFARTCMFLLENMVSEESFKAMLTVYKEHAEVELQKTLADETVARGYKTPYLGPEWEGQSGMFTKFWDCHDVMFTFYDDGLHVQSGSFAEFIPN